VQVGLAALSHFSAGLKILPATLSSEALDAAALTAAIEVADHATSSLISSRLGHQRLTSKRTSNLQPTLLS